MQDPKISMGKTGSNVLNYTARLRRILVSGLNMAKDVQ
jgi:hypothetical protein